MDAIASTQATDESIHYPKSNNSTLVRKVGKGDMHPLLVQEWNLEQEILHDPEEILVQHLFQLPLQPAQSTQHC